MTKSQISTNFLDIKETATNKSFSEFVDTCPDITQTNFQTDPINISVYCVSLNLGFVHTVRFFLIATAIPLITTNGLCRTHWKCSYYATATTSPTPIQPIVSKNKSQLQSSQCEQVLRHNPKFSRNCMISKLTMSHSCQKHRADFSVPFEYQ